MACTEILNVQVNNQHDLRWVTLTCPTHGMFASTHSQADLGDPDAFQAWMVREIDRHRGRGWDSLEAGIIEWFEEKIKPLDIPDLDRAVMRKTREEITEWIAEPSMEEAADVLGMFILWAHHFGYDRGALVRAALDKLEILNTREWEREGGTWHHVRVQESSGD